MSTFRRSGDPPGSGDLDDELMASAASGDRAAWRSLYERHRDFVFRTAFRFFGADSAARDVTQDVFLSLFARASSYRAAGTFRVYLRRVVANRCLNELSSARHAHRAESPETSLGQEPARGPDPEADLERRQTQAMVRAAIDALPPRQRMAVVLSRFEGLSYEEIAAALECSIPSVESLLFRARQALARALSDA